MADGDAAAVQEAARRYAYAQWQKDEPKLGKQGPLVSVLDALGNTGYPFLPPDMMFYPGAGAGAMIEEPLVKYKSAFLPYVEQDFMLPLARTATGGLELTVAAVQAIQLFTSGVDQSGAPNGEWWIQTSANNTLEKEGAPVYARHSYWAFGDTVSFEGLYVRIVTETPSAIDPLAADPILDNGPGSYSELVLQVLANNVSRTYRYQGNDCPRYQGTLGSNGDRAQVIGGGRHSISLPDLPYQRWARPSHFGSKDEYAKLTGKLESSIDLQIKPIGGNAIPSTTPFVFAKFRVRLYGVRVCGNPEDGCP